MIVNVGPAVARLRDLSSRLQNVASGDVASKAAARVGEVMQSSAESILSGHRHTGNAASSLQVEASAAGVKLTVPYYLKFHSWWVFRDGLPAEVRDQAKAILREELLLALKG